MRERNDNLLSDLYVRVWGQGTRVLLIHGSNIAYPEMLWLQQRELALRYQLVIPDRRGYGQSPPCQDCKGYEGNIRDIASLLGDGSHLVGHSYGGLLIMVVATRYPQLVKSLTVIEPPAFGLSIDQPEVTRIVGALKSIYRTAKTPETFLATFLRAMSFDVPESISLSPQHRQAVMTTMAEAEPWDIALDPDTLATYLFPKLVVSGNWHPALVITADILAHRLHANRLIIQDVGHEIQKVGKLFNDRLEALFALADAMNSRE
jgi:pimeloyl-ACP methyl ester carboxylesterase